jgi:hypothetical protein
MSTDGGLQRLLYEHTVSQHPELQMNQHLRQHYRPAINRAPAWLQRIWRWL